MTRQDPLKPHTIVALVQDRPGVLNRVIACWQERGFNIRSLGVGAAEEPGLSRMTFVVEASTDAAEMVEALSKLEEITAIRDISALEYVSRELALVRIAGGPEARRQVMDIVTTFNGKVVDVSAEAMIIEVTGHEQKIDSLMRLLKDFEVVESVRTGRISMVRGTR